MAKASLADGDFKTPADRTEIRDLTHDLSSLKEIVRHVDKPLWIVVAIGCLPTGHGLLNRLLDDVVVLRTSRIGEKRLQVRIFGPAFDVLLWVEGRMHFAHVRISASPAKQHVVTYAPVKVGQMVSRPAGIDCSEHAPEISTVDNVKQEIRDVGVGVGQVPSCNGSRVVARCALDLRSNKLKSGFLACPWAVFVIAVQPHRFRQSGLDMA